MTAKQTSARVASGRLFDPKLNHEAYNFVARTANLEVLQLIESEFKVLPDFFGEKPEVTLDLNHQVCSLSYLKKQGVVIGTFHYEVIGRKGRKHLLKAKSDFLVVYGLEQESLENEAKAFCARVGLFAAYPYFRATFAHLTSFANVELPILPVLSADPLRKSSGGQRAVLADHSE